MWTSAATRRGLCRTLALPAGGTSMLQANPPMVSSGQLNAADESASATSSNIRCLACRQSSSSPRSDARSRTSPALSSKAKSA